MRVEFSRIAGDIYVNGQKLIFAVDFTKQVEHAEFSNVDWLMGWAKIGLMSRGHTVPHFEMRSVESYELGALPPPSEPQGITGKNTVDNQHKKITGYRDLTQDEIDTMNAVKAMEAKINGMIDHLKSIARADQRQIALASTHFETGFMHAVRAIAQPERKVESFDVTSPEPMEG